MIQLKFSRLTISKFNDSSKLTTAGKKILKKDYKCNFIKMGENEKTQANSLLVQRPRLPVCGESLPLHGEEGGVQLDGGHLCFPSQSLGKSSL